MSEMNNELYHHGVKGMKWGVRKSVYKSMNRQHRKAQRKKYYDENPEARIKRAAAIGTFLGGPLVGGIAGGIATMKVNRLSKRTIENGEEYIDNLLGATVERRMNGLDVTMSPQLQKSQNQIVSKYDKKIAAAKTQEERELLELDMAEELERDFWK